MLRALRALLMVGQRSSRCEVSCRVPVARHLPACIACPATTPTAATRQRSSTLKSADHADHCNSRKQHRSLHTGQPPLGAAAAHKCRACHRHPGLFYRWSAARSSGGAMLSRTCGARSPPQAVRAARCTLQAVCQWPARIQGGRVPGPPCAILEHFTQDTHCTHCTQCTHCVLSGPPSSGPPAAHLDATGAP